MDNKKLTAENIICAINSLDKKVLYNYIYPGNHGVIKIETVKLPEGPILIKQWDPSKNQTETTAAIKSISSDMIWRIANAFKPDSPINFDRILGASYNTRSVLETLLVHTPEFYYCYPGRIEDKNGNIKIQAGHKHVIWKPDAPHKKGIMSPTETDIQISEIPVYDVSYKLLEFTTKGLDINVIRRHLQIQIALYHIGHSLGYRTWIAQNDMNVQYNEKRLCEYPGIIQSIRDDKNVLSGFNDAIDSARLIDCIWFDGEKNLPAVLEVEHTTGTTSGLVRMHKLKEAIPSILTRYIIVAPDEDRNNVISKANSEQFADMNLFYFSYSKVEDLFSICMRYKLQGVTNEFIESFMEPMTKKKR